MYKITLKGLATTSYDKHDDDSLELTIDQLKYLDGIDCQDKFSEYFHKEFTIGSEVQRNEQNLIDKGVSGGYMRFKAEGDELHTIIEYNSNQELTNEELEELCEYTNGQLSDGIGEGFEQSPCYSDAEGDYYISPWSRGSKLEAIQEKLN